jgi:hypothetical protein
MLRGGNIKKVDFTGGFCHSPSNQLNRFNFLT